MKKLMLLSLLLVLTLSGCGKDPVVSDFTSRVNNLDSEINVSDTSEIADLLNIYDEMTDDQKKHVDVYNKLEDAYKKLDDHKNESKYAICIWMMNKLYASLDTLDGFSVNRIEYSCFTPSDGFTSSMVYIDYNTNNSYGNSQHKKCVCVYRGDPKLSDIEGESWYIYQENNENYDDLYNIHIQCNPEVINTQYVLAYLDITEKW